MIGGWGADGGGMKRKGVAGRVGGWRETQLWDKTRGDFVTK